MDKIYARKEGETDLYPKPQSSVSNKSTCWNRFSWPYPCIVTKLTTSDISDQQEKNTPTTRWLINKSIRNTLLLVTCTAGFRTTETPGTSVNVTVNIQVDVWHLGSDFLSPPCKEPILAILRQPSSKFKANGLHWVLVLLFSMSFFLFLAATS